jgi:hypothetical protein
MKIDAMFTFYIYNEEEPEEPVGRGSDSSEEGMSRNEESAISGLVDSLPNLREILSMS